MRNPSTTAFGKAIGEFRRGAGAFALEERTAEIVQLARRHAGFERGAHGFQHLRDDAADGAEAFEFGFGGYGHERDFSAGMAARLRKNDRYGTGHPARTDGLKDYGRGSSGGFRGPRKGSVPVSFAPHRGPAALLAPSV